MSELHAVPDEKPTPMPWEQQPSETLRQFACFREYRDLHPLSRSLAEVGQKLGFSVSYLERLSSEWRWVARVGAFDREQDRLGQARRVQRIEEMNERHAEIAATALRKVAQRLETLDARSLRPNEIARLIDVASRAERMARGVLPDEPAVVRRGPMISAAEIAAKLREARAILHSEAGPRTDPVVSPAERAIHR